MDNSEKILNKYMRLIEQEAKQDLRNKIIEFFKENPNPEDEAVHEFAEREGISPPELETQIYALLTEKLQIKIGKHNDMPDSDFDPKELKMGEKIEMEHTDDPNIAKSISKDHLSECKIYYTLLNKMEQQCKKID